MSDRARSERPSLWKDVYALPDPDGLFLGRDSELGLLQGAMDRGVQLITLTGPAGVGKTRLAIEFARRIPGNEGMCAFLRLAPLRDAAMVPRLLASVCALDGWPDLPIDRFPRGLDGVLVLDGFDHVHDAGASITALLERCPGMQVLVTSRGTLQIPGETEFLLGPLDAGTANQLLRSQNEQNTDEDESRTRLQDLATGLPLGLELIGSTLRAGLPVRVEPADGACSQLADVIAGTIDALTTDARGLFERLCISAGGFEASVVASLADCQPQVTGELTPHLAAMSQLRLIRTQTSGSLAARFEIPTAVREVGLALLNASGDLAGIRLAYAAHMLQRAINVRDLLAGPRRNAALAWFEREYDSLRLAFGAFVQLNRVQQTRTLAVALLPYWLLRRRFREARRWLTVALELTGAPVSDDIEHELLVALGLMELLAGNAGAARARSLAGARPGAPVPQAGWRGAALATLGMVAAGEKDFERAIGLYRVFLEATQAARNDAAWTPQLRALTRLALSAAYLAHGEFDEAEYYATMALKRGMALGDPLLVGFARVNLGAVAAAKQDFDGAIELYREGILLLLDLPHTGAASAGILGLAKLAIQAQATTVAARLLALARYLLSAGGPIPPYLVAFNVTELQAALDDASPDQRADSAQPELRGGLAEAISVVVGSIDVLSGAQAPPTAAPERARKGGLSSRELEVLCLAAEDITDLEIADALFISKRTASDHMRNVIGKLGVNSRTGAVARALREDWCS